MGRVGTHLGRDFAWVPRRDQHGPHLVAIEVLQVTGVQPHPSLLIDVRSGEAEGPQSTGLGIRERGWPP